MVVELLKELREHALECEKSERNPITKLSTWPKETTLEWRSADVIERLIEELRSIADADNAVPADALRYQANRFLEVLLRGD